VGFQVGSPHHLLGGPMNIKEMTREEAIGLANRFNEAMRAYRRAFRFGLRLREEWTEEQVEAAGAFSRLRLECIQVFGIKGQNYNGGRGLDAQQICERFLTAERAAAYWDTHNC